MRLSFKDVEDKHKGSPALVIAHGPSLNPYLDRLPELKKEGYIIVGCNEWYNFHEKCPPNYYVLANSIYTIARQINIINAYDLTVVYARNVDRTDMNWIDSNIKRDYLPYDQYTQQPDYHLIQDDFRIYTGHDVNYGSGDTVALHMISTAVMLGCNPVYIAGIDLDYRLGYASHRGQLVADGGYYVATMNDYLDRNLTNLRIINESAKRKGVSIINLNMGTTYDIFPTGAV